MGGIPLDFVVFLPHFDDDAFEFLLLGGELFVANLPGFTADIDDLADIILS